jgi:predicted nucleotidyltransferase
MPRIHLDRLPQLARRLQRFVKKVKQRLPVDRVIMHGSAARGDLTESSDIDLVFIGHFPDRWLHRHRPISDLVPDYLPVEFFCYNPEEFEQGLARGNPFLHEVKKWGRELTGDEPLELRHRGQDREEAARRRREREREGSKS